VVAPALELVDACVLLHLLASREEGFERVRVGGAFLVVQGLGLRRNDVSSVGGGWLTECVLRGVGFDVTERLVARGPLCACQPTFGIRRGITRTLESTGNQFLSVFHYSLFSRDYFTYFSSLHS